MSLKALLNRVIRRFHKAGLCERMVRAFATRTYNPDYENRAYVRLFESHLTETPVSAQLRRTQ